MQVQVGDVRLFFDVVGTALVPDGPVMCELPVLVCLHGGPGFDHSSMKVALSPLAEVAQLVLPDQRGNGRSDTSTPRIAGISIRGSQTFPRSAKRYVSCLHRL